MKLLRIYPHGERAIMDGMEIGIHGFDPIKEYDLENATQEEMESLKKNPHQGNLLAEIEKRK